jgi:hypothetical protein
LAREAGISLDGTDEFGNPIDGAEEVADGADENGEGGDSAAIADEATRVKE